MSGAFVWYELATPDPAAAAGFYTSVLGWGTRPFGPEGAAYTLLSAGAHDVGGIMALPPGARPGWNGYVAVEALDATLAAMQADGATVIMPATDLPEIGRIAVIADPQGVVLCLIQPAMQGESHAFKEKAPGHVNWNELTTGDPAGARAFYGKHFGWQKQGGMPMGTDCEYEFLAHQGTIIGAVMPPMQPDQPKAWNFYWGVPALAPAIAAIKAGGGQVIHGPHPVPGDDEILIALDPQGVAFCLVAPQAK